MNRRITASRASAVRAAQEAKARRDALRLERERSVESALADFYENRAREEVMREQARVRVAKVLRDAEDAVAAPRRAARAAVTALRELGETREQISELTGLGVAEVRAMLADSATSSCAADAVATAGEATAPAAT